MQGQQSTSHWFVSSCVNYETDTDLRKALKRLARRDKSAGLKPNCDVVIYLVPLPATANYSINNYAPQVEGVICVGHCETREHAR